AGIKLERFARLEVALHDGSAGVDECDAVAAEALHNEPFAAKQPDADFLPECDVDADALGGTHEGIFLADDLAAVLIEMQRDDLSRIRRREGDNLTPRAGGG